MKITISLEGSLYDDAIEVANPTLDRAEFFREARKTAVEIQSEKALLNWVAPPQKLRASVGGAQETALLGAIEQIA